MQLWSRIEVLVRDRGLPASCWNQGPLKMPWGAVQGHSAEGTTNSCKQTPAIRQFNLICKRVIEMFGKTAFVIQLDYS